MIAGVLFEEKGVLMTYTNSTLVLILLCVIPISNIVAEASDDKDEAAEVSKIKSAEFRDLRQHLSGTWVGEFTNGTVEDPAEWKPVEVQYLLSGNGSAIVENYFFGGAQDPGMTTVYYPDGADLQLTHYCGAQNHPRMQWMTYDKDTRTYGFRFLDITNLHDESDYHSRSLDLTFVTDNNIRIAYSGEVNGRTAVQTYNLARTMVH
jgi:hypothetical protein